MNDDREGARASCDSSDRYRLHPNVIGGLWILLSSVCFTATSSLAKYLGATYSAPTQTFFSQLAAMLLLLPYTLTHLGSVFRTQQRRTLILRSGLSTIAVTLAYTSYHHLPLADANALSFTRSLWVLPLAALLLGERMRATVIVAGVVAFGGVLLIGGAIGTAERSFWGMAAGVTGAIVAALTLVTVRGLTKQTSGAVLVVWSSLVGIFFSAPLALVTGWEWPRVEHLWLIALMGGCALAQQVCYIKGLQIGEVSAIAPIDNIRIVFAILVGTLVFHELPSLTTMSGIALIIGASMAILWSFAPRRDRAAEAASP
jgi:drug/metabolite transporter (DMT)-like permease